MSSSRKVVYKNLRQILKVASGTSPSCKHIPSLEVAKSMERCQLQVEPRIRFRTQCQTPSSLSKVPIMLTCTPSQGQSGRRTIVTEVCETNKSNKGKVKSCSKHQLKLTPKVEFRKEKKLGSAIKRKESRKFFSVDKDNTTKFKNMSKVNDINDSTLSQGYFNQVDAIFTQLEDFLYQNKQKVMLKIRQQIADNKFSSFNSVSLKPTVKTANRKNVEGISGYIREIAKVGGTIKKLIGQVVQKGVVQRSPGDFQERGGFQCLDKSGVHDKFCAQKINKKRNVLTQANEGEEVNWMNTQAKRLLSEDSDNNKNVPIHNQKENHMEGLARINAKMRNSRRRIVEKNMEETLQNGKKKVSIYQMVLEENHKRYLAARRC